MDCEIAVAGVKPDRLSQLAHGLQAKESITLHSPTALFAQQSGQDVSDGVEVRRNVKSPPLQIVSSIDDDGEVVGGNDLAQAVPPVSTTIMQPLPSRRSPRDRRRPELFPKAGRDVW